MGERETCVEGGNHLAKGEPKEREGGRGEVWEGGDIEREKEGCSGLKIKVFCGN